MSRMRRPSFRQQRTTVEVGKLGGLRSDLVGLVGLGVRSRLVSGEVWWGRWLGPSGYREPCDRRVTGEEALLNWEKVSGSPSLD